MISGYVFFFSNNKFTVIHPSAKTFRQEDGGRKMGTISHDLSEFGTENIDINTCTLQLPWIFGMQEEKQSSWSPGELISPTLPARLIEWYPWWLMENIVF